MLSEMTAGNAFALDVLLNKHKVKLRNFPEDVTNAMFTAALDIVKEKAEEDPFTNKVYKNWTEYRSKVTKLSPLTELGYMSLRNKFEDKRKK
jgi:TRAP-type mannitol/chloroaromatic compound transport system substrate-binding protein